jgi:hypothetical protein
MNIRKEGYYTHGLVPEGKLKKNKIKAVAGIVVSKDGRLLVGTEQVDKPATMKLKGQTSIPFETLKPNELEAEGGFVSAILTEITTDRIMPNIRGRMYSAGVVDQLEVMPDVWVATLLLKFNGESDEMPFEAQHPGEFSDLRWIGVKTLMKSKNVRPFTVPVMERVLEINRRHPNNVDFRKLNLEPYYPSVYEEARQMEPDVEYGLAYTMSHLVTMDMPNNLDSFFDRQ